MKNIYLTGLFMLLGFAGICQQKVVADKIIGIVGDKIVLKSEIYLANEDIRRQGGQEQNDCALLDGMLTQKGLVKRVQKDSITLPDEQIWPEIKTCIPDFVRLSASKE